MNDITHKQISLRTATAEGKVFCSKNTFLEIENESYPKGNIFDISKAAGLLAAKKTSDLIPHCHPVSIDMLDISYEKFADVDGMYGIKITVFAKSIGRTGIEIEAMTALSVTALTIYDLLKPFGKAGLEISNLKLLEKTGGKSNQKKYPSHIKKAAILVCSDSTYAGDREDKSGLIIQEMLAQYDTEIVDYKIVPDEVEEVKSAIMHWVEQDVPFIITTGGTGLSHRDTTAKTVKGMLDKEAPGIAEAMRNHGGMRTPYAMMSASVAGVIKDTMVVTLPGSSAGARESLQAILPQLFHARLMILGGKHG